MAATVIKIQFNADSLTLSSHCHSGVMPRAYFICSSLVLYAFTSFFSALAAIALDGNLFSEHEKLPQLCYMHRVSVINNNISQVVGCFQGLIN